MVKPRFPGHVEAPSATRRATDKWAHDTMRPEQLDSGSTHTSQPQEGCALLHPLQGVSLLSTPLQGGILKPPALRVVVDLMPFAHVRYLFRYYRKAMKGFHHADGSQAAFLTGLAHRHWFSVMG